MNFVSTFKLSWTPLKHALRALIVTLWLTPAYSLPGYSETSFEARETVALIKVGTITIEQFKAEIILHRKRVQFLFQHVARSRGFNLEAIRLYSQLHDLPKIMNLEQLRAYGYTNERTILERLYEFYGLRDVTLSIDDQIKLEILIEDIDIIEKIRKNELFEENKLFEDFTKLEFSQLKDTEHVIDVVDTGLARPDEVGKDAYLASDRFFKEGKYHMAVLALALEFFHRRLKGPLWNNRGQKGGSCSRLFLN